MERVSRGVSLRSSVTRRTAATICGVGGRNVGGVVSTG